MRVKKRFPKKLATNYVVTYEEDDMQITKLHDLNQAKTEERKEVTAKEVLKRKRKLF